MFFNETETLDAINAELAAAGIDVEFLLRLKDGFESPSFEEWVYTQA